MSAPGGLAGATGPAPVAHPPAAATAGDACPLCGAPLMPEQEWCLRCGAAARTRLAAAPNWRPPIVAGVVLLALVLGVIAAAVVKLAGDSGPAPAPITHTVTTTGAAAATSTTPAAPAQSATTAATSTPSTGTPATTTPGAAGATGSSATQGGTAAPPVTQNGTSTAGGQGTGSGATQTK